ncbi:25619_t:CDS:1, partial [Gigaspora rosea]
AYASIELHIKNFLNSRSSVVRFNKISCNYIDIHIRELADMGLGELPNLIQIILHFRKFHFTETGC